MILVLIVVYNIYIMLTQNKLWIPFFFLSALLFLPSNFSNFTNKEPFLMLCALSLGYLLHYFKLKHDSTKITIIDKKYFIIKANQHFPIGVLSLLKIMQGMPLLITQANQKFNAMYPEQMMATINVEPLINYMPYLNIFAIGYFCSLGISYTLKFLSYDKK